MALRSISTQISALTDMSKPLSRGEIVRAFVPPPLPPKLQIDVLALLDRLSHAERTLGRLDGITMLPRQELFLYMYVRKEAVLSSQIEGPNPH